MLKKPPILLALLIAVLPPATAKAQSYEVLETNLCIERLVGPRGIGGGISTGILEPEAWVELCDGRWAQVKGDGGGLHREPPPLPRVPDDPERLPDAQVTRGSGKIAAAWLIEPTDRYGHGVLGDAIEASGLRVLRNNGSTATFRLSDRSVFEDLRVRLADLTGDGLEELIVVRSYLDHGGALAVYGLGTDGIKPLGETPPIGSANRWLDPAGAADFDGDGRIEVAYVETPHIGGTLHLYELHDDGLRPDGALRGFSNHAIGSRELGLAAVLDWNGDGRADLALPDATRGRLMVVGVRNGSLDLLAILPQESRIVSAIVATDFNADRSPELIFALENGNLVLALP